MNRSHQCNKSRKKRKASGYRRLAKTYTGRKIIKTRRRKGRKII